MYHHFTNTGFIETKLSKETMDRLRSYITRDRKGIDFRGSLAGNISESCSLTDTDNWFFNKDLGPLIDVFLKNTNENQRIVPHVLNKDCHFKLHAFWANFQKKHEFNPLHNHTALYSFVVWMKIPTDWKDQRKLKNSKDTNGQLNSCFMFHYLDLLGNIRAFTYRLSPEDEGTLLFFPGPLHHSVHPFYECDDDRITISGNITFNTNKVASNSW